MPMKCKASTSDDPRERLRALRQTADELLALFSDTRPIIIGTLSLVNRKCSNPGCHCSRGGAHPTWTLLTKYQGKRRCQVVRKSDVPMVQEMVERYRSLRAAQRQLRAADSLINQTLRGVLAQRNQLYQ
jgi:hypothetical protein